MQSKTVVIYPGRFQPFHRGHAAIYELMGMCFPYADRWIATSGKVGPDSPFNFEERKSLAQLSGIPGNRVAEVKNPYIASEILANYDPKNDRVIFVISEKDADRLKFGNRKDGSPTYLQEWKQNVEMKPFDTKNGHAYVTIMPVVPFEVAGVIVSSASEIRGMLTDESEKQRVIANLYGNNADKAASIIAKHF
jgi:hypothetical protein